MKIQIGKEKKLEDALLVWHEPLPDVDLVIDPRPPHGLKFRAGTVDSLYAFNVLAITPPDKLQEMVTGWYTMLAPGGTLYITENDLDHLSRAYAGGDMTIEEFNEQFCQKSYVNREMLVGFLVKAGCPEGQQRQWFGDGIKFEVTDFEIVVSATKK